MLKATLEILNLTFKKSFLEKRSIQAVFNRLKNKCLDKNIFLATLLSYARQAVIGPAIFCSLAD